MLSMGILVVSCGVALCSPQDPREEFRSDFEQELRLGNTAGQDRALRRHKEAAILVFVEEGVWGFGSPVAGETMNAFAGSWSRVYRKNFPQIYLDWKEGLSDEELDERESLSGAYADLTRLHAGAANSRKPSDWQRAATAALPLIEGLRDVGDLYYTAAAYLVMGDALHPDFAGEAGDAQQALDAYQGFLDAREALELTNDKAHADVTQRWKGLRISVGLDAVPGAGDVKPAIPPASGAEWINVPLEFELSKRAGSIRQPNDDADDHRMGWGYLGIPPIGKAMAIPDPTGWDLENIFSKEMPLVLVRETADRFHLVSGNFRSETFRVGTNPVDVLLDRSLADGGSAEVGYRIAAGDKDDMLNGQVLPGQITDEGGIVYFRPITRRVGDAPFGDFVFSDGNADGILGYKEPRMVGAVGMPRETWFYRFDTLTIGRSKIAIPFSRWVSDAKGKWYEIDVPHPQKGAAVKIRAANPKLGTVELSLKGLKGLRLQSCILKAEDSDLPGLFVDLMAGKKNKIQLPVGRYSFLQGICRGKDEAEAL
ncbi:MAG TPA: hypothetical protein DDW23_07945, partial [Planctomycetes bacterium]|nr:hypothetical protein [Planctomycetota bacterium]